MGDHSRLLQIAEELGCVCHENEPMSSHTSFAIGGPAELFIEIPSIAVLRRLYAAATEFEIPVFVLGNGSNLLVSDLGIDGAVFHIGGGFDEISLNGAYEICCGAGVRLSQLCSFALENSLSGLEFAWGIPGSAGGAAFMNAGAYDSDMSSVLTGCSHVDANGSEGEKNGDELRMGYRTSAYRDSGLIITGLRLRLYPGDSAEIRAKMDDIFSRRKQKQPLDYPSAGSVFKRPSGNYAGTLIEQCGLKGFAIGDAAVSEKHAGFIINTGHATASDVRRLMEHIQNEVFLQTSVKLEPEIAFVGK